MNNTFSAMIALTGMSLASNAWLSRAGQSLSISQNQVLWTGSDIIYSGERGIACGDSPGTAAAGDIAMIRESQPSGSGINCLMNPAVISPFRAGQKKNGAP